MFYLGGESYRTRFSQRITQVKLFNAAFLRPFLLGYFEEEDDVWFCIACRKKKRKNDEVKGIF